MNDEMRRNVDAFVLVGIFCTIALVLYSSGLSMQVTEKYGSRYDLVNEDTIYFWKAVVPEAYDDYVAYTMAADEAWQPFYYAIITGIMTFVVAVVGIKSK